jgi:hypothetical protein
MATVRTKGSSSTARRRSNAPPRWSVAALEPVYELLTTTERLASARHWDGRVVLRSDAAWSLLRMIEPRARSTLAAARDRETEWATVLLNGLGMREIACTVQILRVIRQRLARDERELRERERQLKHDGSDFR